VLEKAVRHSSFFDLTDWKESWTVKRASYLRGIDEAGMPVKEEPVERSCKIIDAI
jgi:hypothetical protein